MTGLFCLYYLFDFSPSECVDMFIEVSLLDERRQFTEAKKAFRMNYELNACKHGRFITAMIYIAVSRGEI